MLVILVKKKLTTKVLNKQQSIKILLDAVKMRLLEKSCMTL